MGLGVFTIAEAGISPTSVLVAFKNFSTYQVQGAFGGSAAPTVTRVQTDMGCVAGRSIQFVPGVGLIRLTHRGFTVFNGLGDTVISDPIRPFLFGYNDIAGLTWEHIAVSTATQVHNPPLYLCACPSSAGAGLDRVFVFDVAKKAWTICTFPAPWATCDLLLEPGTLPQTRAGLSGGRKVLRVFASDTTDDGVQVAPGIGLSQQLLDGFVDEHRGVPTGR